MGRQGRCPPRVPMAGNKKSTGPRTHGGYQQSCHSAAPRAPVRKLVPKEGGQGGLCGREGLRHLVGRAQVQGVAWCARGRPLTTTETNWVGGGGVWPHTSGFLQTPFQVLPPPCHTVQWSQLSLVTRQMVTSSSGWGAQDFRKCMVSPIGDGIHAVDSGDPPNRLGQTL